MLAGLGGTGNGADGGKVGLRRLARPLALAPAASRLSGFDPIEIDATSIWPSAISTNPMLTVWPAVSSSKPTTFPSREILNCFVTLTVKSFPLTSTVTVRSRGLTATTVPSNWAGTARGAGVAAGEVAAAGTGAGAG